MTQADYVVSVAANKTLEVWEVTAKQLLELLPSATYEVVVPVSDLRAFRDATPEGIVVSAEDGFVSEFADYLREKLGPKNPRFGWYLQQLIKLEAIKRKAHQHRLVIWDADTVPLAPPNLFDSDGRPMFYQGSENHAPYFETVRLLLGLDKVVDFSFVAQCMPLTGQWVSEFFAELETRHAASWWQAIIDCIDPVEVSGFSEYETLGTFINHRFGPLTMNPETRWSRRGYHYYASPADVLLNPLTDEAMSQYDFLAFEDWNRPKGQRKKKRRGVLKRIFRQR